MRQIIYLPNVGEIYTDCVKRFTTIKAAFYSAQFYLLRLEQQNIYFKEKATNFKVIYRPFTIMAAYLPIVAGVMRSATDFRPPYN